MKEPKHNIGDLYQMQSLPLNAKINMTITRVRGWLDHWDDECYISFSGGKDSTVLVDIIHNRMGRSDIPLVFVDTGLEFPEIREFVKTYGEKVTWLRPSMNFRQVIEKYGYPFISKEMSAVIGGAQKSLQILKDEGIDITDTKTVIEEAKKRIKKQKGEWRRLAQSYGKITKDNEIKYDISKEELGMYSDIPQKYKFFLDADFFISDRCCSVMKKNPVHKYNKETGRVPITAQMADESRLRERAWLKNGCNAFEAKHPISNPMSFWTEQDVYQYIKTYNLPICSLYGDIVEVQNDEGIEGQMRFDDLSEDLWTDKLENPKLKTTGMCRTGCMFCGYGCHFEKEGEGRFERMKQTHPKQYEWIMKPWDEGGLGYKDIIDWINEHGKGMNIRI